MPALLVHILGAMLGSALARILVGAGLSVATFYVVDTYVEAALLMLNDYSSDLPAALVAMVRISGVGSVLSMVGSALTVRAAIVSAAAAVTK